MSTKRNIALSILVLGLLSIQTSCNKVADLAEETQITEDHALAEQVGDDVENITSQSEVNGKLEDFKTGDAGSVLDDSVKIDEDSFGKKGKINFGMGWKGKNGRMFKGSILKETNGKKFFEMGYSATVTFEKFSSNDNSVVGKKIVVNNGLNSKGQMSWTITTEFTITKADGKTCTWNSTRTRTMTKGADTKAWGDDSYEITGSASGMASNGVSFEVNITKALVRDMACRFISSGTIEYIKVGKNTKTKSLDFGDGTCDANATLTVDGTVKTILLR